MRKINKKVILLLCLMCVFNVPKVNGMDRIEETMFCITSHHTHIVDNIELDKGEEIIWEFETFNETFEASLFIRKSSSDIYIELCVMRNEHIGEYKITQTGFYVISIVNFGSEDGYVHIVIENKESSISSYPIILVIFFSIIGLIVFKRKKKLKKE